MNANPTLMFSPTLEVSAGQTVPLRASWPAESAETYAFIDVPTQVVIEKRETMRVSWHATGGSFESDRSGRTSDDPLLFTDNTWTAPGAPGIVTMWVVLRDDRGGVAFEKSIITVR